MKGDFSNLRFNVRDHYSSVRAQQGRVAIDSDWNEQVDIQQYRERRALQDLVGRSAVPKVSGGFELQLVGSQLTIGEGRMYVDGILVENLPPGSATSVNYEAQPFVPSVTMPTEPGRYLAYLDVWERHVTAVEDADLADPALGGVDTATRTQVAWAVRLVEVPEGSTGAVSPAEYTALKAGSNAKLAARVASAGASVEPGLGALDGGYRGLDNQLYRVEIHQGGASGTWKWSRENGSVAARVLDISGTGESDERFYVTVSTLGPDSERSFHLGSLIEVSSIFNESRGQPGQMATVVAINDAVLTVEPLDGGAFDAAVYSGVVTIRRWDCSALQSTQVGTWVELEHGVEVKITGTSIEVGDHWVIPARVESGDVLWTVISNEPVAEFARGVRHHYAKLALLDLDETSWSFVDGYADLRPVVRPLGFKPPMWVRRAAVKWADGAYEEVLVEGAGTVVDLPADAEWYLELQVEHVLKNVFNQSNFHVSFAGQFDPEAVPPAIIPAFRFRPEYVGDVPAYPDDDNPPLVGDSPTYTLVVTWKPGEKELEWVADRLALDAETPLDLDLSYSDAGVVQATAHYHFVLVLLPTP